jgi:hypothetical protein
MHIYCIWTGCHWYDSPWYLPIPVFLMGTSFHTYSHFFRNTNRMQKIGYIYYLLSLQKLFEMRSAFGSALLGTLWHHFAFWVAQLCTEISINTRECCRLNDFWATFYILGLKNANCDYAQLSILQQAIYRQLNNIFIHNKLNTEESSIHSSFWFM